MTTRDEDFTFYVNPTIEQELPEPLFQQLDFKRPLWRSIRDWRDATINFTRNDVRLLGRALICPCFAGKYLSVTVRVAESGEQVPQGIGRRWPTRTDVDVRDQRLPLIADWPNTSDRKARGIKAAKDLISLFPACHKSASAEPTGLVIVSGRTGSGKSTVARELLRSYVNRHIERVNRHFVTRKSEDRPRIPHIITFERPIEEPLADTPEIAMAHGFNYTPRAGDEDAGGLDKVLLDALRQTPTVVFVGETREIADWRALLRFAGSGHLVVTTAHAGSLVETMSHLLTAGQAKTASDRSEVVSRIRTILHVRRSESTGDFVPAMWENTAQSLNAMTAEGLGSLLPHRWSEPSESRGTYGRTFFAERLIAHKYAQQPAFAEQKQRAFLREALSWDLAGE